jgi:hypothetical protein
MNIAMLSFFLKTRAWSQHLNICIQVFIILGMQYDRFTETMTSSATLNNGNKFLVTNL